MGVLSGAFVPANKQKFAEKGAGMFLKFFRVREQ
jgi:hypothetical protein